MANESTYRRQDADLNKTIALPDADGSVYTTAHDLGAAPADDARLAGMELEVRAPALDGTELPAAATMVYVVQHSTDNSTFASLYGTVLTQTGAASVGGAAATTKRVRLPSDCNRYVRLACTGASIGDCSDSDAELRLLT